MLNRLRVVLGADARRAVANFAFKAIAVPIEKTCRIVVVVVAAPALGDAAFGTYQFATTLTALFAMFADLGLSLWTTRALSRDRSRASSIVGTGLRVRALSGVLYGVAVVAAVLSSGSGQMKRALVLFGAATLANTFIDYFGAIFRGFERFRDEAWLNVARGLLVTAAALGALRFERSLSALGSGVLAGTLASLIWGIAILRRYHGFARGEGESEGGFDGVLARRAAAEAAPMWLATLLSLLYFKIDVVILRSFVGDAELGAYSAAFKVFEALTIVPSVVMTAAFSPLARAHGIRDRQRRWETSLVALLLALGALVALVIFFASDRIVALLFGVQFVRGVPSLKVLSFGVPVMFLNTALWQFLIARDLEVRNLLLSAVLLLVNVGVNLALIPRLRGPGAAWATVVTEVAHALLAIVAIRWAARRNPA